MVPSVGPTRAQPTTHTAPLSASVRRRLCSSHGATGEPWERPSSRGEAAASRRAQRAPGPPPAPLRARPPPPLFAPTGSRSPAEASPGGIRPARPAEPTAARATRARRPPRREAQAAQGRSALPGAASRPAPRRRDGAAPLGRGGAGAARAGRAGPDRERPFLSRDRPAKRGRSARGSSPPLPPRNPYLPLGPAGAQRRGRRSQRAGQATAAATTAATTAAPPPFRPRHRRRCRPPSERAPCCREAAGTAYRRPASIGRSASSAGFPIGSSPLFWKAALLIGVGSETLCC